MKIYTKLLTVRKVEKKMDLSIRQRVNCLAMLIESFCGRIKGIFKECLTDVKCEPQKCWS